MRRFNTFCSAIALCMLMFLSFPVLAWKHGVSLGYGSGPDINHHTDTNSGAILSADFYNLVQKYWLNLALNASVGSWYTTAPIHKDLFTAALSFAFRFYLFPAAINNRPYLLASAGPSYLSDRKFGRNNQGANFAFQTILGAGMEFLKNNNGLDLNIKFVHYSNAYLIHPNEGFNILYVVSVGYLFS